MIKTSRLLFAGLTAISIFILPIGLFIIWTGILLPEPHYTANSYNEIVFKEFILSIKNVLLNMIIIFLPVYIISLSFKAIQNIAVLIRLTIIFAACLFISIAANIWLIHNSLLLWKPLVESTNNIEHRSFTRGRGHGGLKSYVIDFTVKGSDLSILKTDIIPYLESAGYTINDFGISLGESDYTSIPSSGSDYIYVKNIHEIPFEKPLQKLDYAMINFVKNNQYSTISLLIHNYQGNQSIEGFLESYY